MRWRRWTLDQDRRKATDSGIDTWAALAKAGRSALDPARSGRIGAGSAQLRRAGASIPKRRDPRQDQGISAGRGRFKDKKIAGSGGAGSKQRPDTGPEKQNPPQWAGFASPARAGNVYNRSSVQYEYRFIPARSGEHRQLTNTGRKFPPSHGDRAGVDTGHAPDLAKAGGIEAI